MAKVVSKEFDNSPAGQKLEEIQRVMTEHRKGFNSNKSDLTIARIDEILSRDIPPLKQNRTLNGGNNQQKIC